ncbi:MAG: hypothetical protein PWR27_1331 [Petroclostridium sp.]|uniref:YlmH family RNA-binding protein n=1 Tax=Petroclostridium xylanilyticum TaxID=1792311 RepID=UPI000B99581C|nr:YlmH/Sll1252 family protein [Petroclostridium xylanilyticum]MBZ4646555.1 hypothetical protein [Clostridia bacterium]MDK2810622.1 hypothetical protein [Petroclostridium sp.]
MFNKQEILETLKTSEDKLFVSKVLDQAVMSLKYHEERFTSFLDPYQQNLLIQKLKNINGLDIHCWGGYEEAERKIISIFPDYMSPAEICYPISILEAAGSNFNKLSHRDFLGAVLALGIKREKIGDILINDTLSYIFTVSDISQYILMNLNKVANSNVVLKEVDIQKVAIPQKKYKEIHGTVATLRLDSVLSVALGESRSKVLPYIHSEKVNVNWELSNSPSQVLREGDVISVRGHGRMLLDTVGGITRKGRINITIKRFI